MGAALCPGASPVAITALLSPAMQLVVSLSDQAPPAYRHTWTKSDYTLRDAHLATLGVQSFRKMGQLPTTD
jgi:hypothetical protein